MAHAPVRSFSTLLFAATALLVTSACSDDSAPEGSSAEQQGPAPASEIDACGALTAQAIEQLGLTEGDAVELVDPKKPGCEWSGVNAAAGGDAEVLLWVLESGSHSDFIGTVTISGVEVSVWQIDSDDDGGRYVVPCGDQELVISYHQNHGPLGAEAALELAAADMINAYGCAAVG